MKKTGFIFAALVLTVGIIISSTAFTKVRALSRYDLPDPMNYIQKIVRYDLPEPMGFIRMVRYDLPEPLTVKRA